MVLAGQILSTLLVFDYNSVVCGGRDGEGDGEGERLSGSRFGRVHFDVTALNPVKLPLHNLVPKSVSRLRLPHKV